MRKDIESAVRPTHYNSGDISCIDAMIAAFGVEEVRIWCKITAFKYIWRMGKKDAEEQEVGKTKWYLDAFVTLKDKLDKPQSVEAFGDFRVGDFVDYRASEFVKAQRKIIKDIIVNQNEGIKILFDDDGWFCARSYEELNHRLKHTK